MRSRAFQTQIAKYLLAVALVTAAGCLYVALAQFDSHLSPLLSVMLAVVISAWVGELGPGLLATGLGVAAARLLPSGGAAPSIANEVLFVIAGVSISCLMPRVRIARIADQLKDDRGRVEQLNGEVTREIEEAMSSARLTERMASLGTLSAGLGHDIGNLLLPIRLRLDAMATKGVPAQFKDDIAAIATCTDHLQRLANGLRLLSMDPKYSGAPEATTDLQEWWRDAGPVLKNALPRGVDLQRDFADDVPPVALARHLLTQAVFNLVQNAGHAIEPGMRGVVRVWAEPASRVGLVTLGVTDNGSGMTAETRARCLEPFFTNRPRAMCTGLGLTLVHATVKQVGGGIHIQSEPGEGTTIALSLPSAVNASNNGAAAHHAPSHAVVVVEDARTRAFIGAVLGSIGFIVAYDDAPDDESSLLVADATVSTEAIRSFLEDETDRRCVVLGPRSDTHDLKEVVHIDEHPTPAAVRATFNEMNSRLAHSA